MLPEPTNFVSSCRPVSEVYIQPYLYHRHKIKPVPRQPPLHHLQRTAFLPVQNKFSTIDKSRGEVGKVVVFFEAQFNSSDGMMYFLCSKSNLYFLFEKLVRGMQHETVFSSPMEIVDIFFLLKE